MENYSNLKKRLLTNKNTRKAYDKLAPEFTIAQTVIEHRIKEGLTQSELAKKVGTRQSAISRLESGNYNPSINFLEKVAKALNLNLTVSFSG
ncbi:helix-turn-helix domain-containing protein [Patescibacteria group bacterium]|nr:helix-turn-helix domain-containing protein [Patescibacteria group bacterium]MBU1124337.1 helix-turn-helix domain-containing protein [Patescibacteria group bacterium]